MKKRSIAILMVLVLAFSFVLVGCDNANTPSDSTGSNGSGSTTPSGSESAGGDDSSTGEREVPWDRSVNDEIIVSVINPYYTKGWQVLAEQYTAMWPETTVTVDVVGSNDAYSQKMTTWLTADDLSNAGDIVHVNFAAGPVGGYGVMFDKDMIYDFRDLLDDPHPYNNNTPVRDLYTPEQLRMMTDLKGQVGLPFDMVGVAMMYNKAMLDELGIAIPETREQLIAACEKFRTEGGVQYPILATAEANWYMSSLADAALRHREQEFLVQPGDGVWEEGDLMAANVDFQFDENNWECDRFTVFSGERMAIWAQENQMKDPVIVQVWDEFAKMAMYFQENFNESSSAEVMVSFAAQNAPFFMSGSWNVGAVNKSVQDLDEAEQFEWGTIGFLPYETAPEGWQAKLRTLYGIGNTMGIIKSHGEGDHLERVKDFYLFVYSPTNALTMFNETLNAGDFIQGPAAMKGVELPADVSQKLEGFVQVGAVRGDFGGIVGQDGSVMPSDKGIFNENLNALLAGEITAQQLVETLSPYWMAYREDQWEKQGFDFDPLTKDEPKA